MYCIDAHQRIVTKSLYRTALPYSTYTQWVIPCVVGIHLQAQFSSASSFILLSKMNTNYVRSLRSTNELTKLVFANVDEIVMDLLAASNE
jgi:hypothetical protein